MSNYKKYGFLVVVILVIGILLYYTSSGFSGSNNTTNTEQKTGTEAKGTLALIDSAVIKNTINPSGTYLLYQLLKTFENTRSLRAIQTTLDKPLYTILPDTSANKKPNLYVSITEKQQLNYTDEQHLLDFVKTGNYAFIAAEQFSEELMLNLLAAKNPIKASYYDTTLSFNFVHPDFKQPNQLQIKNADLNDFGFPKYTNFSSFDSYLLSAKMARITSVRGLNRTNCILVKHGKGHFVFLSTPTALGNYNVLTNDGKTNAEILFSHFPECNIYWHQNYGKYSEYRSVAQPKTKKQPSKKSRDSPLQFIVKQPALLWAFVLFIIGILIYFIIFTKRQQRIIPVLQTKENSSLQFVDSVSKLYFQQKQHNKLIVHIYSAFGLFVRERYYINLQQEDPDLITRLSEKSGIEPERIHKLMIQLKAKQKTSSESQLIDLYKDLNYFYENCN